MYRTVPLLFCVLLSQSLVVASCRKDKPDQGRGTAGEKSGGPSLEGSRTTNDKPSGPIGVADVHGRNPGEEPVSSAAVLEALDPGKALEEWLLSDEMEEDQVVGTLVELVQTGRQVRLGRILESSSASRFVEPLSIRLCDLLTQGRGPELMRAREALFDILSLLSEARRASVGDRIVSWAMAPLRPFATRSENERAFGKRLNMLQVVELGVHAKDLALFILEKGLRIEGLLPEDIVRTYVSKLNDPDVTRQALSSLRSWQLALLETGGSEEVLGSEVLGLVAEFASDEAFHHLLDLCGHEAVPAARQREALKLARELNDSGLGPDGAMERLDRLASVVVKMVPFLQTASGRGGVDEVDRLLSRLALPGFEPISVVTETGGPDGLARTFRPYVNRDRFHPLRFFEGVAVDTIRGAVEDLQRNLENELKPSPVMADEAVAESGRQPVWEPAFDPEYRTQRAQRVDASITPLLAPWLQSPLKTSRLMALSGLRFLGTPEAWKLIQKHFENDLGDYSAFLGEGADVTELARVSMKLIELRTELAWFVRRIPDMKIADPKWQAEVRDWVRSIDKRIASVDILTRGDELETGLVKDLAEGKNRIFGEAEQRRQRFNEDRRKVLEFLSRTCDEVVKPGEYPRPPPGAEKGLMARIAGDLDRFLEQKAEECRVALSTQMGDTDLEFFGVSNEELRDSVKRAVSRREIERRVRLARRLRAAVDDAVDLAIKTEEIRARLDGAARWTPEDPTIAAQVDSIRAQAVAEVVAAKSPAEDSSIDAATVAEHEQRFGPLSSYVFGALLARQFRLERNVIDLETSKPRTEHFLIEAAREALKQENVLTQDEAMARLLTARFPELYFVFLDHVANRDDRMGRWGLSNEEMALVERLEAWMQTVADQACRSAVERGAAPQEAMTAFQSHYPMVETIFLKAAYPEMARFGRENGQ